MLSASFRYTGSPDTKNNKITSKKFLLEHLVLWLLHTKTAKSIDVAESWKSLFSEIAWFNSFIKVSVDSLLLEEDVYRKNDRLFFFPSKSWEAENAKKTLKKQISVLKLKKNQNYKLVFCIKGLIDDVTIKEYYSI